MGRDKLSTVGERVVRIGVTGHREIDAPGEVAAVVDGALDDIEAAYGTDLTLVVVSALAEGADRLVVDRVLARPEGALVALLPLAVEDYERDFATPESRAAFHDLLARAHTVRVVPTDAAAPREVAYEAAGLAMLQQTDVVLALWDGEESRGRGGTAEIVRHARAQGRRVVVIPVSRPAAVGPVGDPAMGTVGGDGRGEVGR